MGHLESKPIKRYFLILPILLSLACGLPAAPLTETPSAGELVTGTTNQLEVQPEALTETPMPAHANVSDHAIFSIHVQHFSYPQQSATVLDRIITLHETYNAPVDIYLTDVMAQIYAEQFPRLVERLKTSPVASICLVSG